MRLWSLSPAQLDSAALRQLWKDGLKAMRLLRGERIGRMHHPQLQRWQELERPIPALFTYLRGLRWAAALRGIRLDRRLLMPCEQLKAGSLQVQAGQLAGEWRLYLAELRRRNIQEWEARRTIQPKPHPLFTVVPGELEVWEREVLA